MKEYQQQLNIHKQIPIIWKSITTNVDIDTGEIIQKGSAVLRLYTKIKTTKHVHYNTKRTRGYIEYTNEYRRSPQKEFEFRTDNNG